MKAKYLLILITLIRFNWIGAQVSYNYKLYTTEDGLISNTCYKIFQDSKGYLWVSHDNGVSRFNGKKFINIIDKNYTKGNWKLDAFFESEELPNSIYGSSPNFLYDLTKEHYVGHDSLLVMSLTNWNNGVYLDKPIVDHDGFKIYLLNKRSKYVRDTVYYSFMGKYDYVILPSKLNNNSVVFISSQDNTVYLKTIDTLSNEYSYMSFIKGKIKLILKSKKSFGKIEKDNKGNYLAFSFNKVMVASLFNNKGVLLKDYNYKEINNQYYKFNCVFSDDDKVWIPSRSGIVLIDYKLGLKEFIDNDRQTFEQVINSYDETGAPFIYKEITDDNYRYLVKNGKNDLINGDRLFSNGKFYDLLPFNTISKITNEEIDGAGINHLLVDVESNIWIASNAGLMRLSPIPIRPEQNYLSKKEKEFYLAHTDLKGRKYFINSDDINRKLELKIVKEGLICFSKTYDLSIIGENSGMEEMLKFFDYGDKCAMMYNSKNNMYELCFFKDIEIKKYGFKNILYSLCADSTTLYLREDAQRNLILVNELGMRKTEISEFWNHKLRPVVFSPYSYYDRFNFIDVNKNLGRNLTVCKINKDHSIDTFAFGNFPLATRYSMIDLFRINTLGYDLLTIDKNGQFYLANEKTFTKLKANQPFDVSIYDNNKTNDDDGKTKDVLRFKDYLLFTKKNELLVYKFDTVKLSISSPEKFNFSNGLPNINDNMFMVSNNYLIISSQFSYKTSLISYENFKENRLSKPVDIKTYPSQTYLFASDQNAFKCTLNDLYFNKKAPFINIYHIGYYSGGEFVIDSSQIIHNYPSSISNLTFSYDAISLAEGDYIQTKYNVLGFDTTWQSINTNEIKFSSLPPGSYTLQIKACNNHNNWSVPKQFIFSIDYPWYRTWFAYILYIVVGGGVIYLFIKSRTKKLEEEKEKLEKIVEERTAEVVEEKKVITEQKHLIEEKHREITDSINYAERIQRSFLATKEQLDNNLSDYFILFKPKDVVSGDFYWSHTLQNGNFALVTADSTGHGVPGAIMSLLNTSSIERAVELGISEPAEILNHTRQTIIERLKKDGSAEGGKDGMDCSLISFNKEKSKFAYAAANNPIWIIRNKELIELAPDKIPVGKHDRDSVSFTQHEVEIQKGDMIYTLTDGFPDQFGGPKGKKFMYKKLKEMLITIAHKPTAEQQTVLKGTLKDWMGNTEQVDDVTIIGVRV